MTNASPDTAQRILAATRDLLVQHGVEGLSMRKIAHLAGISAPAIYRHFADKDALLSAAVHAGALTFTSYLVRALTEPSPISRLRMMGQQYFSFAEQHYADYQVLFIMDCHKIGFDQLDQRARAATSYTFQLLVDRVVECQRSGELAAGDPTEQSVFIWSSIHGLASVYLSGHMNVDAPTYRQLVESQLDRILQALRPYPAAPSASSSPSLPSADETQSPLSLPSAGTVPLHPSSGLPQSKQCSHDQRPEPSSGPRKSSLKSGEVT